MTCNNRNFPKLLSRATKNGIESSTIERSQDIINLELSIDYETLTTLLSGYYLTIAFIFATKTSFRNKSN